MSGRLVTFDGRSHCGAREGIACASGVVARNGLFGSNVVSEFFDEIFAGTSEANWGNSAEIVEFVCLRKGGNFGAAVCSEKGDSIVDSNCCAIFLYDFVVEALEVGTTGADRVSVFAADGGDVGFVGDVNFVIYWLPVVAVLVWRARADAGAGLYAIAWAVDWIVIVDTFANGENLCIGAGNINNAGFVAVSFLCAIIIVIFGIDS